MINKKKARKRPDHPLAVIFRVPLLIAALSLIGLISALVGDATWDALSWFTLGSGVAVMAWYARPKRA